MKRFNQSAFVRFFTKFPPLFLAGLMFSVPLAIFIGIFVLICKITGFNNIIIAGLGIIPAAPFYAGLVMVIRKYATEKQDVNVISTFFQAVRDNFKYFLVHGIVFYIICACSVFSMLYYYSLSQESVVFGSVLTLYLIFSILMIVMMFYVPLMTITYDLKLTDIYKNAFLLVFGKILRSLAAAILVAVVTVAAFFGLMFSGGFMIIVSVILIAVFYPLVTTYIINSVIAKGVQDAVGDFVGVNVEKESAEVDYESERLAVENADSNSDYVFVNGRMIKKNKDNSTDSGE